MSYTLTIDELNEVQLEVELRQRADTRAKGLCDYCGRRPSTPDCKVPDRHNDLRIVETQPCSHCRGDGQPHGGSPGKNYCEWCQGKGTMVRGELTPIDDGIKKGLSFEVLRAINVSRCTRWHSDGEAWNVADWTNALCGEAGEAANFAKKIRRIDTNAHGRPTEQNRDELVDKLGMELADTVIYADLVADFLGLDLAEMIRVKFNRTSVEYGFPERL